MSETVHRINAQAGDGLVGEAYKAAERLSGLVLVDGELRAPKTDEVFDVIHPGDRKVIGHEDPRS